MLGLPLRGLPRALPLLELGLVHALERAGLLKGVAPLRVEKKKATSDRRTFNARTRVYTKKKEKKKRYQGHPAKRHDKGQTGED